MGIFRRQPFRRQILTGAGLLVLPFLILVVIAADRSRLRRRAEIGAEARFGAAAAVAYLDERFNTLGTLAEMVAGRPDIVAFDPNAAHTLFGEIVASHLFLTEMMLIDSSGRVVARSAADSGHEVPAWLSGSRAEAGAGRWSAAVSPSPNRDGRLMVAVLAPVRALGPRPAATLALTIDPASLSPALSGMSLPAGSVVTLADRAGRIMLRTVDSDRYVGQSMPPSSVPSSAVPEVLDVDGVTRLQGAAATAVAPLVVSVGIPQAEVARRLRPMWYRNFSIAIGACIGSVLMSLWIASKMSRHLEWLRRAAQRIAAGDLSLDVPPSSLQTRELVDLHSAFAAMAASLRVSRETIEQQLEQERTMNDQLQSLQRQVVRQERMAAVGQLAAGLAHELNNPLQAIMGAAHLLNRSSSLDADGKSEVEVIKTQSARAVTIIRSLSRFGTPQRTAPALVDLAEVVDDVAGLQLAEEDAGTVTFTVASRGRRVYGSFTELQQVVFNLLTNARHAVASLPKTDARVEVRLSDIGRWIRLEVSDNGDGVAPDDEGKLFQPFFTTKPVGQGRGLGLSVSHGIIRSCGGTIGYVQNDWGGATFFFELLCVEGEAAVADDGTAALRRRV